MRVAINVEQLLYHSPGGVGRYTAQVAGRLPVAVASVAMAPFTARHGTADVAAALDRAGVAAAPTVLGLPRPLLYEAWHLPGPGMLGPRRLAASLRDVDVVHAPSVACPPREGVPLVVSVHDAAPVLFPEAFPRRGLRFHLAGLAATRRRADRVLTFTEAAAEEVAAACGIGRDRITVVHHGVEARPADPAGAAALARRGLDDRPFVLWVGSLEPRKGVGTLVAAMARLRRRGAPAAADARLVLAGPAGWLSAGLVADDDRAALGDDLVQTGPLGEAELWATYAAATVVAVPSRHEGFGYPVVEAMAAGTPVVASDIPALAEVADGAARLVPPGDVAGWADAIEHLLADAPARDELVAAGRARAAQLTVAASLRATAAVYAALC
ncbi:MAG TPA: glycosyltransferase family 1 protein [Acidimicrobiales bacterium]|nr:glycosyltransferase family 1 protein [Acidimicrobiales bacterium]